MGQDTVVAIKGTFVHCLEDPGFPPDPAAVETIEDGIMVIRNGVIESLGPASKIETSLDSSIKIVDHSGELILPGLIDCHVHFPQLGIIASYGEQLLDWLTNYAFPMEERFLDAAFASAKAEIFADELLRHGTTTAMVFATVHPQSVDAIFEAAKKRRMRLYAGKVLMDRNCPESLRDTPQSGYEQSEALIERWHGQDRLGYAITPRFAPTSSNKQLERAGELANKYPDVHIHTHVAENLSEVQWVRELFPESRSYLDVYQQYGLMRDRSVFAHCIHLDDEDISNMRTSGSAIAFCPSSNLFLGSGLFNMVRAIDQDVRIGLGSDVGGGTSLSMIETVSDAYKVLQLQQLKLSAYRALYLATLGGAEALYIEDKVGNFGVGKEADFIVIDRRSTSVIAQRVQEAADIAEELFVHLTLGDDRAISATYLMGNKAYDRSVKT